MLHLCGWNVLVNGMALPADCLFTAGNEDCPNSDSDSNKGDDLIQEACSQMECTRLYETDWDDED